MTEETIPRDKRLMMARKASGMTQRELSDATLAKGCHICDTQLSRYESGQRIRIADHASVLSRILGIPFEDLL